MSIRTSVALTSRYATVNPGGIEAFVAELVPMLSELRPDWKVSAVHAFAGPFRLERIPLFGDLLAALALARKTVKYDVVLVNGAEYAWPRALRKGTRERTIVVWHGTRAAEVPTLAAKMTFAIATYRYVEIVLQRAAFALARQIVVGKGVLDELRAAYGTTANARIIVNGVPVEPPIDRRPNPFDILWVGTNAFKKGLDVAIAACAIARARFPELRLRVVGLSKAQLPIDSESWIVPVGRISRPQLLEEYRTASLLLATTRYEGCSIAILEAMRHGVPIAASPALHWMFEGCGCSAESLDAEEVAKTLERGLSAPEVRGQWALCGRRKAEQFTWERAASAYVEEIEAVLQGNGSP